jgi:hypothetical protein
MALCALQNDVNFPERCALLVERHCDALKDFTGEKPAPIALDIGCAVGGATFYLSRCGFGAVLGMDYSRAFINAANVLKKDGMITYCTVIEGKLTVRSIATTKQCSVSCSATMHVELHGINCWYHST